MMIISACSFNNKDKKPLTRADYAPIKLAYVDFKIPKRNINFWSNKVGNYNFELFGCTRRDGKDIVLDTGRVMQRQMSFFNNFFEGLNNYYSVIVDPKNPYFIYSDTYNEPEYLVIAEITDLFLNVCDHYDWRIRDYKNLRSGSSEIEVTWKITDLTRRHIFWQASSKGYAEIDDPIVNGETRLVEKAFAASLERARHLAGFAETLAHRRSKNELNAEKTMLADLEYPYFKHYGSSQTLSQDDLALKETGTEQEKQAEQDGDKSIKTAEIGKVTENDANALGGTIIGQLPKKLLSQLNVTNKNDWLNITPDDLAKQGYKADDGWIGVVDNSGIITIKKQPAFSEMNPYILYRIRTGIVSVENKEKKLASGLLISPEIILTSDNVALSSPELNITTINNFTYTANPIRRNPLRGVALLKQKATEYYPLPLRLTLPEVGEEVFFALGAPTYETGEGFLDDKGIVTGYRYLEDGTLIMTNTYVQEKTLGGALIDKFGNILGMAKGGLKDPLEDKDYFIPVSDALEKLGVVIKE